MKSVALLALAISLMSAPAQAKITVYQNQDALEFALRSEEVRDDGLRYNVGELVSAQIRKYSKGGEPLFQVDLAFENDDTRRCESRVIVKTVVEKRGRPNVMTSRLAISRIETDCAR